MSEWLLGRWRSDRETTMRHWAFRDPDMPEETRQKIGLMFGALEYVFTRRHWQVIWPDNPLDPMRYVVESQTSTSIRVRLLNVSGLDRMTIYRAGDMLAGRSGRNFEYFRRVSSQASLTRTR